MIIIAGKRCSSLSYIAGKKGYFRKEGELFF
jgi:hypothetical protein